MSTREKIIATLNTASFLVGVFYILKFCIVTVVAF